MNLGMNPGINLPSPLGFPWLAWPRMHGYRMSLPRMSLHQVQPDRVNCPQMHGHRMSLPRMKSYRMGRYRVSLRPV